MRRLLDTLVTGEPVRSEQPGDGGLNLYPLPGHEDRFDDLVRELLEHSGLDYVAFPRSSALHHYDHVLLLRLED
jgi:hypothetical protein